MSEQINPPADTTARYTVTEHSVYSRAAGREGYTLAYSVRLPDVQQVPGAATRYLETAAGRRRSFRSRFAAQEVADSLNAVLDRALAKQAAELAQAATEAGESAGYDHANYVSAYGGALKTEKSVIVPGRFVTVYTHYITGYLAGQEAYADEQDEAIAEESAQEPTLAQKVVASVNQRARQYQGMIHGEDGTTIDVEFPAMAQAALFVNAFQLDRSAVITGQNRETFTDPVLITFPLETYARIHGIRA